MNTYDMVVDGNALFGFQALSEQTAIDAFFYGRFGLGKEIPNGHEIINLESGKIRGKIVKVVE